MDYKHSSTVPRVLFIGNGINKAYGESSWEEVINNLSTGEYDYDPKIAVQVKKLPYALQTIVLSSDSVFDGMKMISEGLLPHDLKSDHSKLLNTLASLPFDAILTPNYSYEIEKSLDPDFDVKPGRASKYRRSTYKKQRDEFGLFKYFDVSGKKIWHIHGEAARPNSMVMGHYYYGKLLGEIQKRIPEIIKKRAIAEKYGNPYVYSSWIECFLLSDIHIVGFGLDPSEMDIWWLINAKKRHFSDLGRLYYYEPNLDDDNKMAIRALIELFNINYETTTVKGQKQYIQYYNDIVTRLSQIMEAR